MAGLRLDLSARRIITPRPPPARRCVQARCTRYDGARAARGEMLSIEDVLEILSTPLLGIIPESQEVLRASNLGAPVTLSDPASGPARAYVDAARRLNGESVAMAVPGDKKRLLDRLFGRRAA
jgi:septum site-determining protein MinD